jgi:hypothetical protein
VAFTVAAPAALDAGGWLAAPAVGAAVAGVRVGLVVAPGVAHAAVPMAMAAIAASRLVRRSIGGSPPLGDQQSSGSPQGLRCGAQVGFAIRAALMDL